MTTFQLWNDDTNNLIDIFPTETAALDEVRWRFAVGGSAAVEELSLVCLDADRTLTVVAFGDELLGHAREMAVAPAAGSYE